MKRLFTLVLMFGIGLACHAQELQITNGKKVKEFDFNDKFRFKLEDSLRTDEGTGYYEFFGSVAEASDDSIRINLVEYHSHFDKDLKLQWNNFRTLPYPTQFKFAVKDISAMQHYKSTKSSKGKIMIWGFGTALIFTGLMTSANTLIVSDKQSKKTLLWSGVVQLGAGITMTSLGKARWYRFSKGPGPDPWRFK